MTGPATPQRCSWELLHACNYRCPYCFFIPSWKDAPEQTNNKHLGCSAEDWLGFWRRLFEENGPFCVELSGGEPFLYPDLVGLVRKVSAWHPVRITTNLSWRPHGVLERFDRLRVSFVASFHSHSADLEEFLAKAAHLKACGFRLGASVVAYPPIFDRLPEFKEEFRRRDIPCSFSPFQGRHLGRLYPKGYTADQKTWLRIARSEGPAFEYATDSRSPLGRACAAGMRYFRAYPDGWIYRCISVKDMSRAKPMGSIKDPDFKLFDRVAPCPANYCLCKTEYRNLLELS